MSERNFPFNIRDVPTGVKIDGLLLAQERALAAVDHLPRTFMRVHLFWVKQEFEYRQYIERWIASNAIV